MEHQVKLADVAEMLIKDLHEVVDHVQRHQLVVICIDGADKVQASISLVNDLEISPVNEVALLHHTSVCQDVSQASTMGRIRFWLPGSQPGPACPLRSPVASHLHARYAQAQRLSSRDHTCASRGMTSPATSLVIRVRSFCEYVLNHLASLTLPCLFINMKKCICISIDSV